MFVERVEEYSSNMIKYSCLKGAFGNIGRFIINKFSYSTAMPANFSEKFGYENESLL
jgi:hypothetical protein